MRLESIDVIILAGGFGTRIREIVQDLPKPLAPIQNKPFLDLLLRQLTHFNLIRKVVFAVSYKANEIIHYYQNHHKNYLFKIDFSFEKKPLGTGGAVKQALSFTHTKKVLVLNGDSYADFDLDLLFKKHLENKNEITIVLTRVENSNRYGQIEIDQNTNKILAFNEKSNNSKPGLINTGVYLINRDVLDQFPKDVPLSIEKDIFPKLLQKAVYGFLVEKQFIDIGTKESYLFAQDYLKELI